ncbi:hypothetical protein TNCV_4523211 [Trichonephila clavipes]|nr:hypothetical protein TNCV_4523211 [Trichonephila clavipes]
MILGHETANGEKKHWGGRTGWFESRVRHVCIFFGKEVGLSPEMDSRLEKNSSAPLLVICWDHRLVAINSGPKEPKGHINEKIRESVTDCLRYHFYRTGITDSPDCTLRDSGQPMTVEHLVVCPALISLYPTVEKYWKARARRQASSRGNPRQIAFNSMYTELKNAKHG